MNTSIGEVGAFLQHIVASTNMRCLTPPAALDGDCGFLAANLYAKCVDSLKPSRVLCLPV